MSGGRPGHASASRRRLLRALRAAVPGVLAAAAVPGLLLQTRQAQAQRRDTPVRDAWPQRPIRLLVAYPPGGVSGAIARDLADGLQSRLGVPVLVEHRAGAGGGLAIDVVAKAAPDGLVLCFSAVTPLTLSPHLGPVPYDPLRDVAPVMSVMVTPVLVVGTPALQADSLAGMLTLARREPGRIRWATSGLGTTGHLVLERIAEASGVTITHVPYKGGGQQLSDALGGQFEVLSSNVGRAQLAHVRDGRFKPLAVGAPARLPVLPEVPTLAELGFAPANLSSTFGVFAPGGTPAQRIARLNEVLNQVLADPALRAGLAAVSNVATGGSAADFARLVAAEHEANRRRPAPGSTR